MRRTFFRRSSDPAVAPPARARPSALPRLRFMLVDADGKRVGRFETSKPEWGPNDVFEADGRRWRILEILPEVSTMVAYNAVWVVAPASA